MRQHAQENLIRYDPAMRSEIITFAREASAEFRAGRGVFRAPPVMRGFASFNAATRTIKLSRSEMADAKLAALVEELIHFRQAQRAGVFGKPSGWFSRYSVPQWNRLSLALEKDVDRRMRAMGFYK